MAGHSRPKDGVLRTPMSRPSTSFLLHGREDVDARHKAGHDAEGVALLYNVHSRPFCVKSRIRRSSIPLVPAKAGTQFLRKSAGSPLARG